MKNFLIFSIFFTAFAGIKSAEGQITFQKTFGGPGLQSGYCVQQTSDAGYIIAGYNNVGNFDIYLIKTNTNGDTLWTRTFGGLNDEDSFSLEQTADGGYIITGRTKVFGPFNYDVFLIKTDGNGNSIWSKQFGGANEDIGTSVQQTTDCGFIVTGYTSSFGAGANDVFLIKYDNNGDTVWTKTFGGPANDVGSCVKQTTDGGYIITGGTSSFGSGGSDVFLIKADGSGNLVWSKTFGGTGGDAGKYIQQTTDGGYIISGTTSDFATGNSEVYLIKTDSAGDLLWSKTFGGMNEDRGSSIQQTTDGGYIASGYTYNFGAGIYLIKTDVNGDTLWTKVFGDYTDDTGYFAYQTIDGGYIITGAVYIPGGFAFEAYLIKTDGNGNSGCNERGTATIVSAPVTQVTNPLAIDVAFFPSAIITPVMSVGSGGVVTTFCATSGIIGYQSFVADKININPNPVKEYAVINAVFKAGDQISITDVLGKIIFTKTFSTSTDHCQLSTVNFSNGVYFAKAGNRVGKFVKQ